MLRVEIAVDWSWVFAFVLTAWTLVSAGDRMLPGVSSGVLTLLSGVAAIGLFASLAVHGIAHALGARACGVPVRRLTLFLFGGITDVERDPASPRSEALAAVVAPLANAILGASLLALVVGFGGLPQVERIERGISPAAATLGLLAWLGAANVAIAALNLLPAYPLDGGRLVRAAIWRATGDVEQATRWAAWGGQVIGWAVVASGVVYALAAEGARSGAGLGLAFGGWFLSSASAQAYQGVLVQNALAGITVGRLMRRRYRAVPADLRVGDAVRAWPSSFGDVLAVVDGERFVGVVSMRQLRRVRAAAWESTRVSDVAVRDPSTHASPTDEIAGAHRRLIELEIDQLPVVEGGRLVGLVERADVDRWIENHAASPAAA